MIDERKLRDFEKVIDSWRERIKDDDQRKTIDEVFDQETLLSIYKVFNDGILETVDYPVSTGKEGNVFKCTSKKGLVALKIYRVATSTFKHISKYIAGDARFRGFAGNKRKLIHTWARKEYSNLERMLKGGVRVPKPLAYRNNILVMEYIGDETAPAPLLKDVKVQRPRKLFEDVIENMRKINDVGLVHADMSEFNILMEDGKPVIIDVAQGVPLDHPLAEQWFERDVENMARYFRKLRLKVDSTEMKRRIRGG